MIKIIYLMVFLLPSIVKNANANDEYRLAFVIKDDELSPSLNLMSIFNKSNKNEHQESNYYTDLYNEKKAIIYDPWKSVNRKIFNFNDKIDNLFMLKIIEGYYITTPLFLGIVDNIYHHWNNTPLHLLYSAFQLDIESMLIISWRFVLNTALGYAGVYDFAGEMGLRKPEKSIDQALVYYGIPRGPYIVAPFFGPSTITNSLEFPLIIGMNLYNPYTGGLGLPIGISLMYSWLGNTAFAYGLNWTSLLLPQRFLYLRAYALLISKGSNDDSINKYEIYKSTYMNITDFAIKRENDDMLKGRFKKEKPLPLSHHNRIDLWSMENEFQLEENI
jgi:ABC-type transporter lipoprotein component MlaA